MNRLQRWDALLMVEDGKSPGILDVAMSLHGTICGSSVGMNATDMKMLYFALVARLNDWTPSSPMSQKFDDAVRQVVEAAIEEFDLAMEAMEAKR